MSDSSFQDIEKSKKLIIPLKRVNLDECRKKFNIKIVASLQTLTPASKKRKIFNKIGMQRPVTKIIERPKPNTIMKYLKRDKDDALNKSQLFKNIQKLKDSIQVEKQTDKSTSSLSIKKSPESKVSPESRKRDIQIKKVESMTIKETKEIPKENDFNISTISKNSIAYNFDKDITKQELIDSQSKEEILKRLQNIETRLDMSESVWKILIKSTLELQKDVTNLCNKMENETKGMDAGDTFKTTPFNFESKFPLQSAADFQQLNKLCLNDKTVAKQMYDRFFDVYESNVSKWINTTLKNLLGMEVVLNYNWLRYGSTGNLLLFQMKLIAILIEVANTRYPFVATEDIKKLIKNWFS